ncbi:lipid droplet-associated protein [Williamsia soli]|uniref:lipid droplet-associated protein n=1 Tax=Williamsia soli TaxID=364929 RepID=UPI001A9DED94|nr:lipid droplet-associated protein [Williamsia soli]
MIRPPYAARVAAGVVVTVLEETRKLPTTAITLPMSAVSQTLQAVMRFQQGIAEMAIKGDDIFESLLGRAEEEPEWATFDEDDDAEDSDDSAPTVAAAPITPATTTVTSEDEKPETADDDPEATAAPAGTGRFALYSSTPHIEKETPVARRSAQKSPEIVVMLDYDTLTLAQLRAKLRGVGLPELKELAEYEKGNRARAPFLTMLDNRVTAASK